MNNSPIDMLVRDYLARKGAPATAQNAATARAFLLANGGGSQDDMFFPGDYVDSGGMLSAPRNVTAPDAAPAPTSSGMEFTQENVPIDMSTFFTNSASTGGASVGDARNVSAGGGGSGSPTPTSAPRNTTDTTMTAPTGIDPVVRGPTPAAPDNGAGPLVVTAAPNGPISAPNDDDAEMVTTSDGPTRSDAPDQPTLNNGGGSSENVAEAARLGMTLKDYLAIAAAAAGVGLSVEAFMRMHNMGGRGNVSTDGASTGTGIRGDILEGEIVNGDPFSWSKDGQPRIDGPDPLKQIDVSGSDGSGIPIPQRPIQPFPRVEADPDMDEVRQYLDGGMREPVAAPKNTATIDESTLPAGSRVETTDPTMSGNFVRNEASNGMPVYYINTATREIVVPVADGQWVVMPSGRASAAATSNIGRMLRQGTRSVQ